MVAHSRGSSSHRLPLASGDGREGEPDRRHYQPQRGHQPLGEEAAAGLLESGKKVTEGVLDMVEMAFRAHDPCFGCATHALPGQMPLEVTPRDAEGRVLDRVKRG